MISLWDDIAVGWYRYGMISLSDDIAIGWYRYRMISLSDDIAFRWLEVREYRDIMCVCHQVSAPAMLFAFATTEPRWTTATASRSADPSRHTSSARGRSVLQGVASTLHLHRDHNWVTSRVSTGTRTPPASLETHLSNMAERFWPSDGPPVCWWLL